MPQHQKARGVVGLVFNVFRDFRQAINFRRRLAGNRRHILIQLRQARRLAIAGHRHALHIAAQMRVQPKLALRQRLRVRIHLLHVFQAA